MKREHAVAIQYHSIKDLPRVLAQGGGEIARKIIEIARDNRIPVEENEALVDLLSALPLGSSISPESYRLMAEVLCFLYNTDREWKLAHSEMHSEIEDVTPKTTHI